MAIEQSINIKNLDSFTTSSFEQFIQLAHGIDKITINGRSCLIDCIMKNNSEFFPIAIKYSDINQTYGKCKGTALGWAVYSNKEDFVRILLDKGVDPNKLDMWGAHADRSLLIIAMQKNNLNIFKLLLKYGAIINDSIIADIEDIIPNDSLLGRMEFIMAITEEQIKRKLLNKPSNSTTNNSVASLVTTNDIINDIINSLESLKLILNKPDEAQKKRRNRKRRNNGNKPRQDNL
jgi:ankyrin repeat protein